MNALNGIGIEITDTIRIIGGGSKSALWRQIVADTLNIPMIRVLTDDSSIGSAMLAGVAGGYSAPMKIALKYAKNRIWYILTRKINSI